MGTTPKTKPHNTEQKLKNDNAELRKQLAEQRRQLNELISKSKSGGAGGSPGIGGALGPGSVGVAAGPDISIYHNMLSFQQDQLQNMMRCANSKIKIIFFFAGHIYI